jgi:hypothetical protein
MRVGAGLVVGAFMLAVSAVSPPARPPLGHLVPFAGDIEATNFIDGSLPAGRKDAATGSPGQAAPIFGMATESVAGEVAAKWHAVEVDID